jgi:hypothetical protein
MLIEIYTKSAEDVEEEGGDILKVVVDGEQMLFVYDDTEDPENNRLRGSFASIYGIRTLLEKMIQAGRDMERVEFKHKEI